MKLDPIGLAAASALAVAIVWTLCSVLVLVLPSAMLGMSGHMLHSHLGSFSWILTWTGYFVGLVAWSLWAGFTGWLLAVIYNRVKAG